MGRTATCGDHQGTCTTIQWLSTMRPKTDGSKKEVTLKSENRRSHKNSIIIFLWPYFQNRRSHKNLKTDGFIIELKHKMRIWALLPFYPYNAIFLKSPGSKDIKTDIPNCQIHKYTNTAYDEVPGIPNICYISKQLLIQGCQKWYSQVSKVIWYDILSEI